MDRVYPTFDDLVLPTCVEWETDVYMKRGERRTLNGIEYVAKIAHLSSAANMPDGDPTIVYARAFTGPYSATRTYLKYEAVSYNGYSFYSLVEDNLGHTPDPDGDDTAYWGCYAKKGATGAQGIQGDPGGDANHWAIQEEPAGTKDGVNKSFTLAHTPTGPVEIWWGSGLGLAYMVYGVDYTNSGTALTLITFAPKTSIGDYIRARYPYA